MTAHANRDASSSLTRGRRTRGRVSAGDRTARRHALRHDETPGGDGVKRHHPGQPMAPNDANGDLRFDPAGKCPSSATARGAPRRERGRRAVPRRTPRLGGPRGTGEGHRGERPHGRDAQRGGLYRRATLASCVAPGAFQVADASYGIGAYNRIAYDPHKRLSSDMSGFPGLLVDRRAPVDEYLKWTVVDICGGGALKDACLNTLDTAALPPLLVALAPAAVLDACGSRFPTRTHFA